MERLTEYAYGTAQLKKLATEHAYASCHDVCDECAEDCEQDSCTECPINEAFKRLAAYKDTELMPEEITALKESCGGDVKSDFAIEAILCRKEAAAANLEKFKLQKERDTLKKALELACRALAQETSVTGEEELIAYNADYNYGYFLAQEQEGKK